VPCKQQLKYLFDFCQIFFCHNRAYPPVKSNESITFRFFGALAFLQFGLFLSRVWNSQFSSNKLNSYNFVFSHLYSLLHKQWTPAYQTFIDVRTSDFRKSLLSSLVPIFDSVLVFKINQMVTYYNFQSFLIYNLKDYLFQHCQT